MLEPGHFLVPCGRCIACRINKQQEWSVRMLYELEVAKKAVFATFTYSNEFLPADLSLRPDDLMLFWKRLRKRLDRKIKYFACGEYGGRFGRPHYHAIIFGMDILDDDDMASLRASWPFGFVHCGTATVQSMKYVAKYIFKKYGGDREVSEYDGRVTPFQRVSKGIGLTFALKEGDKIKQRLFVSVNGAKVPVPRYFRSKLGIVKEDYKDVIKSMYDKDLLFYEKKNLYGKDRIMYMYRVRKQRQEELSVLLSRK